MSFAANLLVQVRVEEVVFVYGQVFQLVFCEKAGDALGGEVAALVRAAGV